MYSNDEGETKMKYYPPNNKSIFIREVYEDTYKNINEYIVDTMLWENRVDELSTIWYKGKDPKKIRYN
jgi:hypothetical protein